MSLMRLGAEKCPHGVWYPHNALMLEDGTTVDDPEGACPGGTVQVRDKVFRISQGLALSLQKIEEALPDKETPR